MKIFDAEHHARDLLHDSKAIHNQVQFSDSELIKELPEILLDTKLHLGNTLKGMQ